MARSNLLLTRRALLPQPRRLLRNYATTHESDHRALDGLLVGGAGSEPGSHAADLAIPEENVQTHRANPRRSRSRRAAST